MKVSTILSIKAIVSIVFGVAFVLAAQTTMGIYGADLDATGAGMARYVGATLLGIGLICALCRGADDDARRGITLSLTIADIIGTVVALQMQLAGLMNALGWVTVAIWLLLAIGMAYSRFVRLA